MPSNRQSEWLMRIVNRMDRFYAKFFGDLSDEIDKHFLADGWQLNASLESIKPMTSTVHWPKSGKVNARARMIGGLLGHSVAHYEALCHPKTWAFVADSINVLIDFAARVPGSIKEDHISPNENPFLDELPAFQSALGFCIRLASKQSREEQIQFFEGYSKALRRGSLTIEARPVGETTRTTAFQVLALFGPLLRLHLRSVGDVHRFLVKALGPSRAGSLKRTEALCKALEIKFRSPGRPPLDPKRAP